MYKSGVYKDLKDCTEEEAIAKAMLKVMLGRSHGMTEMEALQSIYLVNGRPSVSADFRAARLKRAGYGWEFTRRDAKGCTIALSKDGKPLMETDSAGKPQRVTVSFLEADAKAAGLLDEKRGGMYEKWGTLMYAYKALTMAQKLHAPEVLGSDLGSTEDAVGSYEQEEREAADEVTRRLDLKSEAGTRAAQAEVAAKKIAEIVTVAAEAPVATTAAPAKMTLGGGK